MGAPMLDTHPTTDEKVKVFISYARADMAFADRLEAELRSCGIESLIDRSQIYAFEDWWKRIQALIDKADTVIFILSPDAVDSDICQKEVAFAASLNKRFAPIVYRHVDVKAVPKQLAQLNFLFFDAETKFDASFARLTEALATNIDWVRRHTEFGAATSHWNLAKRPSGLLLRSPLLEEAEKWIASRPRGAPEPTAETRVFLAESRRMTTRRRNILTGSLMAGLVLALGLAGVAYWQRGVAEQQRGMAAQQRDNAVKSERLAKEQRDQALLTQSKYLTDAADQISFRDPGTGLLLALEALPDPSSDNEIVRERPYWAPAAVSLDAARRLLREKRVLIGHMSQVLSIALTTDGTRIIAGSSVSGARVWDAISFAELGQLGDYMDNVTSVAVTADGTRIITGSANGTVRVRDAKTFAELGQLRGHNNVVLSVAATADGGRIITGSSDHTARVWDAQTFAEVGQLGGHTQPVRGVAVTGDGTRIVTGSEDNIARIWDARTFAELGRLEGHTDRILSVAVTADGARIITGSTDRTARVWDARTFAELGQLRGHSGEVSGVVVSTDGAFIVSGSHDATVRIWDAKTFALLRLLDGHTGWVTSVAATADGRRVISGSGDGSIRMWDPSSLDESRRFYGHTNIVTSVAATADRTRIITGSFDATARVWDARTSAELGRINNHSSPVWSVAVTAHGSRIITGSADHKARVWDGQTFAELGQLNGHTDVIWSVAVTADGARIVTGSQDSTARIWDSQTFAELGQLKGHSDTVRSVAVTADGARIITGSGDGTARIWDARTFIELGQLKGHEDSITSVAVTADGTRIITGSADSTARVWDGKTFAEVGRLNGHTDTVRSVAIAADGTRLLTGSNDYTARVWDASTFVELSRIHGHRNWVTSVALSVDGERIFTGSNDNTARTWEVFPVGQKLIDQVKAIAPRCLTAGQRRQFHLPTEPPQWCFTSQKWPYDINSAAAHKMRQGSYRQLITDLDRAIAQYPSASAKLVPLLVVARSQFAWNVFAEAVIGGEASDGLKAAMAEAQKAVELAPNSASSLRIRGQIHLALGEVNEALADFDEVFARGLNDGLDHFGRGSIRELKGSRDAAIADYHRVLELIGRPGMYVDNYQKFARAKASDRLIALGEQLRTEYTRPK
jgi:WD40 repeat protein